MNTIEFLRALWPSSGLYCIATPFKRGYAHHIFDTVVAAAAFCAQKQDEENLFFCVHTLKTREGVWNPTKEDWKTEQLGAMEKRCQDNMAFSQDYFFDLDVGESTKKLNKYDTQADALAGIKTFCRAAKLPRPYLVSSGGGVHVHWLLEEPIESREWQVTARKLRALANHLELRIDPARTDDSSSLMRIAGTFNLKSGGKRPVEVLMEGVRTPNATFLQAVNNAMIRLDVPAVAAPRALSTSAGLLGNNLTKEWTGEPVTFQALWDTCQHVRDFEFTSGFEADEPARYDMIGVVRLVEDGRQHIDSLTAGRDSVTGTEIDKKIIQWGDKGATSCLKLAQSCGTETCKKCPFWSRESNPLTLSRKHGELLPAPVAIEIIGQQLIEKAIPSAPYPYTRTTKGISKRIEGDGDDGPDDIRILDHDLYPVRRMHNAAEKIRHHVWCAELPLGKQEFSFDAASLCDLTKMATILAAEEIIPGGYLKEVVSYMSAYIKLMRDTLHPDPEYNHLGWEGEQHEKFILPDHAILADGTLGPVQIDKNVQVAARFVGKQGSLEKQIELLKFYNPPEYFAQQFVVLCGLAAPTFYMTGHHGIVVSTWGETGGSKSTAVSVAASLWGHPERYVINGTRKGMTENARNERINTLMNLPICVDETTHMSDVEVQNLAEGITQASGRVRSNRNGKEQASPDGEKATILCTSSNSSMHDKLSRDNSSGTAGSMRVFEMHVYPVRTHTKEEAMDFLRDLNQNYGHIGEYFLTQIMPLRDRIENRIRAVNNEIDKKYGLTVPERFWSAVVADALVVGRLAVKLGLLSFDIDALEKWIMTKQLCEMRGVLEAEYTTAASRLENYLEEITPNIVVVGRSHPTMGANIISQNRSDLRARYERELGLLWVLKSKYREFCIKQGANSLSDITDLHRRGIIINPHSRKVLGAGADGLDKTQSWCFVVNMLHPDIKSEDLKPEPAEIHLKLVSND